MEKRNIYEKETHCHQIINFPFISAPRNSHAITSFGKVPQGMRITNSCISCCEFNGKEKSPFHLCSGFWCLASKHFLRYTGNIMERRNQILKKGRTIPNLLFNENWPSLDGALCGNNYCHKFGWPFITKKVQGRCQVCLIVSTTQDQNLYIKWMKWK